MKNSWICLLLLPPLVLSGCQKQAAEAAPTPTPAPVEIIEIVNQPENGQVTRRAVCTVDEASASLSAESYQSSGADENAILVAGGASLSMDRVDVDKTGDASGGVFSRGTGVNAAIAVAEGAQLSVNGGSVTASGYAADGICAVGQDSSAVLCGTYVAVAGEASACVVAVGGAKVTLDGVTASAEGADSPCVILSGGGAVALTGSQLLCAGDEIIRLTDGDGSIELSEQSFSGMISVAGEGTLRVRIQNHSVFTGSFLAEVAQGVELHIDDSCQWVVTGDTEIGVLIDTDATLSNILSGGFTVYYDSSAEGNAWLEGKTHQLPQGGFLAPRI